MTDSKYVPLLKSLGLFLIILAAGTCGYYFIEGGDWTVLDAFYMTLITVTTIGYGETHPLSDAGRVFTIFVIISGIGAAAVCATQLATALLEQQFGTLLGRRKMQKKIDALSGHYVVCGYSQIGGPVCDTLREHSVEFVVIESGEEAVSYAERKGFLAVKGDCTKDSSLIEAGIKRASGMVICLDDYTANLVISLAARELNPRVHIIALGEDPSGDDRLIRAGADSVAHPLKLGGEQIAHLILQQMGKVVADTARASQVSVMGCYMRIFRNYDPKPIAVKDAVSHLSAAGAPLLRRSDGTEVQNPGPTEEVSPGDSLLVIVRETGSKSGIKTEEMSRLADEMMVGIAEVDEEHLHLLNLVSRFAKAADKDGEEPEAKSRILSGLIDYACKHFENEERLMKKHAYPGLDEHVQEHRNLTAQVAELVKDRNYMMVDNISQFLYSWLTVHIIGSDKKFGEFVHQQKASGGA